MSEPGGDEVSSTADPSRTAVVKLLLKRGRFDGNLGVTGLDGDSSPVSGSWLSLLLGVA